MAQTSTSKAKRLVVVAPLVQARDEGGRVLQLYRGAPLDGIASSEVERLIELGMVGDAEGVIPGVAVLPDSA